MDKSIVELARTIRSKNAGSSYITLEIIFNDPGVYHKVKDSRAVSPDSIARAYKILPSQVLDFCFYDPGLGIKANIKRKSPSGGPGETDVYGCQQYAPLLQLTIPWD